MAWQACFHRHRTEDEIARASATDLAACAAESDQKRAEAKLLGSGWVCTHLGCVPLDRKPVRCAVIMMAGFALPWLAL